MATDDSSSLNPKEQESAFSTADGAATIAKSTKQENKRSESYPNKEDGQRHSDQLDEKIRRKIQSMNGSVTTTSDSDNDLASANSFIVAEKQTPKRVTTSTTKSDNAENVTSKRNRGKREGDRLSNGSAGVATASATGAATNTATKIQKGKAAATLENTEQPSDFLEQKLRIANRSSNRRKRGDERGNSSSVVAAATAATAPDEDNTKEVEDDDDDGDEDDEEEVRPGAVAVSGLGLDAPEYDEDEGFDFSDDEKFGQKEVVFSSEVDETNEEIMAPVAMVVDNDELEREFRETIMQNAATAEVVDMDKTKIEIKQCIAVAACFVLTIVGVVILSVGLTRDKDTIIEIVNEHSSSIPTMVPSVAPSALPTTTPLPTLETIVNNGVVRCAAGTIVPDVPFIQSIGTNFCRALAAAIFGNPDLIEIIYDEPVRDCLVNMTADVGVKIEPFQMDKALKVLDGSGFTFSDPIFFDGYSFGGKSPYVECADRLDGFFGECRKVRICTDAVTAGFRVLKDWFPSSKIRQVSLPTKNLVEKLESGECNVIGAPRPMISSLIVRTLLGYTGDYKLGSIILSKSAYSMMTRNDDHQWSDFVNWIVRAIIAAEHQGITKDTAHKFMNTSVFGSQFEKMFVNAISALGNYGELYRQYIQFYVPRESHNMVNNGSTGLMSSFPLGQKIDRIGPDPVKGSTIESIRNRGFLQCGITSKTDEDVWKGMDKDYCRALSASLFGGNSTKVQFIEMNTVQDGFVALDSNEVDILGGGRITLEADVFEPMTGKGYTFSLPYFHSPLDNESFGNGSIALVTREDDTEWSSFVFWIVSATILAEEEGTTQQTALELPPVNLFGLAFQDMFRHAVAAVGNYDEIYNRAPFIPDRSGRNKLNLNLAGPQLYDRF